jgi:hypothetical protein
MCLECKKLGKVPRLILPNPLFRHFYKENYLLGLGINTK